MSEPSVIGKDISATKPSTVNSISLEPSVLVPLICITGFNRVCMYLCFCVYVYA